MDRTMWWVSEAERAGHVRSEPGVDASGLLDTRRPTT